MKSSTLRKIPAAGDEVVATGAAVIGWLPKGWPGVLADKGLASTDTPFRLPNFIKDVLTGQSGWDDCPRMSPLLPGRELRALREATGLALETLCGVLEVSQSHVNAVEDETAGFRESADCLLYPASIGVRGVERLFAAMASFVAWRAESGAPLDYLVKPTTAEASAEVARLEVERAEREAADPLMRLRRLAEEAVDGGSQATVVVQGTFRGGWSSIPAARTAFADAVTPRVLLDLLDRLEQ